MRKYIIGFIAGILIATAGVAAADTVSMVGKKIQSEAVVTLDGKEIGTAIITDGTSYAPLRVVGEAVGVGVGWEKGVVKLETQTEARSASYWEGQLEVLNNFLNATNNEISRVEKKITTSNEIIESWEFKYNNLAEGTSDKTKESYSSTIADLKQSHKQLEDQLSDYQARASEIEQEIIYVKVQLAAAQ